MFEPEAILKIIDDNLKENVIFGDLLNPESKTFLAQNSLIRTTEPGQVLCKQDQIGKAIFLIVSGEVEVSMLTDSGTESLGKRSTGDLIGEISGLFMMPHIATVTVTQPSIILQIPTEAFLSILDTNPYMHEAVIRRCNDRIIETSMRCVPLFRGLDRQAFKELCGLASLVKVKKGEIIAHEGKTERRMYAVCSGIFRVFLTVNGKEVTIDLRSPGDFFGEYSLFTGNARSASVSASSDAYVVVLEGEAFQSFVDYNEETESGLNQEGQQRKQSLDRLRDNLVGRQTAERRMTQIQHVLGRKNP